MVSPTSSSKYWSLSALMTLITTTSDLAIALSTTTIMNGGVDVNNGVMRFPLMDGKKLYERRLQEIKDELRRKRRRLNNNNNNKNNNNQNESVEEEEIDDEALSAEGIQIDALYQGYGTHYVDLWVGTPNPQRQTVIVDTGSSITAFPCAGCKECGDGYHTDSYYDYERSQTFRKLSCGECLGGMCRRPMANGNSNDNDGFCSIHMSYAEGSSWSAFEAEDELYAGGSHNVGAEVPFEEEMEGRGEEKDGFGGVVRFRTPLTFGCQTTLTGLFRTQLADGIMGMSNERNTFWDQMHKTGAITKKQFALCFSRRDIIDLTGTGAGAMTIGGYDPRLHKTPMVYTPMIGSGRSFFTVNIKGLYLRAGGGSSVLPENGGDALDALTRIEIDEKDVNSRGVIVDSGTTDTYFTSRLAKPFKAAWKELTGGLDYHNNPMTLSAEEVKTLPTLIVKLSGVGKDQYEEGMDPKQTVGLWGEEDEDDDSAAYDVLVAISPEHYMEYDEDAKSYTARIYLSEASGSVLGANAMQGHDLFFDLENERIGIAESDCEYAPPRFPGEAEAEEEKKQQMMEQFGIEDEAEEEGGDGEAEEGGVYGGSNGKGTASSISGWYDDHLPQSCKEYDQCRQYGGVITLGVIFGCIAILFVVRYYKRRRRGIRGVERVHLEDFDDLDFNSEREDLGEDMQMVPSVSIQNNHGKSVVVSSGGTTPIV